MKLSKVFNIKNILSFIEGHYKYFYNEIIGLDKHLQEQVLYRLSKCKDTCLKTNECQVCGCPPKQKVFVKESCNEGEIFPDLMNKEDWEEFKKENNITITK